MARLVNPPKDSLYAISSNIYATKIRDGLDRNMFDTHFAKDLQEFTERIDEYFKLVYKEAVRQRTVPGLISDIFFQYIYYCSHRAHRYCSDIALSEHLATQLYLSGTENVPYNEVQTDSAITSVSLQSADLVIQEDDFKRTKIVACVLFDIDRINNTDVLYPLTKNIDMGLVTTHVADELANGLRPKYMYIVIGETRDRNATDTQIIGLSSIYQTVTGDLALVDFESRSRENLEFKLVEDALYDAQNSDRSLYSYLGIALDMALKAVILNRLGDFRGEARNFTTPYTRSLESKRKPMRSKKGSRKKLAPRRSSPYAVTYMQSSDVPWIPPEEAAEALEREIDALNEELQRISPNTRNHYKMIWVVERYIQQHRIPQSDIYAEDESRPRRNKYGEQVFKKRYLIKRLYTFDSSSNEVLDTPNVHVKRLSSRTNPTNGGRKAYVYELGRIASQAPLQGKISTQEYTDLMRMQPEFSEDAATFAQHNQGSDEYANIKRFCDGDIDYYVFADGWGSADMRVLVESPSRFHDFVDYMMTNSVTDYTIEVSRSEIDKLDPNDIFVERGVTYQIVRASSGKLPPPLYHNPYDAINELTGNCSLDSYEVREFMEEHYPYSVTNPNKFLEDHPEPPYKHYHSADFTWIGSKGRMIRIRPEDTATVHPVEGNIFDDDKICAIADAPTVYDFKIPFICGYCEVYIMDCDSVLSAMSGTYDIDYYEPDADDVGEVHIQLRDGNHRTIGALASGNDAYVFISDNQYQDYEAWVARGKPSHVLYEWLDDNLI